MTDITYEKLDLYHYTTLEGLFAIVSNKTLRLTDYRFLNDKKELSYSISFLEEFLSKKVKSKELSNILKAIEQIKNHNTNTFTFCSDTLDGVRLLKENKDCDTNFYVFSMTNKSDDLALWSMYGKSGCRIKLNSQKLFEYFYGIRDAISKNKGIFDIIRGDVNYCDDEVKGEECIINIYLQDWQTMCLNIYRDLYQMLSLRKKQSYSYESEYRIGIPLCDEMIDGCSISKEFFVKNNTIKPCLEFKEVPICDIIEDIVVSPFNTSDCVCLGVKEFLRSKTNKNIRVESSKIDIRE